MALPSVQEDLHASTSGLQWTIDAYTLVLASLLMLAGSTADRIGRKRVFMAGLVVFGIGSLLCSLAPNLELLVAFRMVQAVGGSMLNPVAMSIITSWRPQTSRDPGDSVRSRLSSIFQAGSARWPAIAARKRAATLQSALALGVATLGTLFLSLIPELGMRDALVTTLLVQLAGVVLTGLLSLRLPRTVG